MSTLSNDTLAAPAAESQVRSTQPMSQSKDLYDPMSDMFTGNMKDGVLHPEEMFWVHLQPWLADQGYTVRPRFRPGWKASWLGTEKQWWESEDGQLSAVSTCGAL
jgi:hypothetical protein